MNVVLNGCGSVGQALLQHWKDIEADVRVAAIRRSDRQWVNRDGCALQAIELNKLPFEPLEEVEVFLENNQFKVWFELTPTDLNKAQEVHARILKVLQKGISVVFANKAPVLHDYMTLKNTADEKKADLGMSAVMGASLPAYALAHYGAMGAKILAMKGILNSTTNFILAHMEKGMTFAEALYKAQEEGIAEPHWEYDIDGIDSAVKMTILASVISAQNVKFDPALVKGIRTIDASQIEMLKKEHKRYKLVASYKAGRISVEPEIFSNDELFYHVNGSDKVLYLQTDTLSDMSVLNGHSGLREVAASMHRDLLMMKIK